MIELEKSKIEDTSMPVDEMLGVYHSFRNPSHDTGQDGTAPYSSFLSNIVLPCHTFFIRVLQTIVRIYKKKSTRGSWSLKDVESAVTAVKNGELSLREASQVYSIPKSTLERHKNKKDHQDHLDALNVYLIRIWRKDW